MMGQPGRGRPSQSGSKMARMPEVSPRVIAWRVLDAVQQRGAYANVLLPQLLGTTDLDARDRAFATDLVYTTLRWRGLTDAVIEHCANRDCSEIDTRSLNVLRLGATQVLVLDVPAHAAVDSTVNLVAELGSPGARGFVNAIMRAICKQDLQSWQQQCAAGEDIESIARQWSHPRWIASALRDALVADGRSTSELVQLLEANNQGPRPTLCARPGLIERDALIDETAGEPGRWSSLAVTQARGDLGRLTAIGEGLAGVQDEGSQVVALIAAGVNVDGVDESWLDMCAGPGGKAAVLAGLAAQRGASLTAVDAHEHRVELVKRAVMRYSNVRTAVGDATTLDSLTWYRDGSFDRVLLDAPCTGIGSLRRRPDLRWQRHVKDVADLAPLQEELLLAALRAVRPGGVVTYATCSPHISETTVVIDRVRARALAQGIETNVVNLADVIDSIPGLADASELRAAMASSPYVRLWPHVHGTDSMFAAVLRRV